jgi:hypothetical protein
MSMAGGFGSNVDGRGSMHAFVVPDRQPRHLVLQLQLATLEFRQSEIVRGGMLEGFGELVFEHPMPLFEFRKMRRCSHGSSWSDFEPDSISLTRGKKGVDIDRLCNAAVQWIRNLQPLPEQAELSR